MSDAWVEVVKSAAPGGRKYYWDRHRDEVRWAAPPGVRVVWVLERHPSSGHHYYWNKETHESCWTLPARGGRDSGSGVASGQKQRGGRGGALVADEGWTGEAWEDSGSWNPSQPSGNRVDEAQKRPLRRPRAMSECSFGEPGNANDVADCARRVRAHISALEGLRDAAEEVPRLIEEGILEDSDGELMLFESDAQRDVAELFPSDFFVVEPLDTAAVSEGYLVVDVRGSALDAGAAIARLARCWWSLAQASARFATLLFVVAPAGGAGFDEDARNGLSALHRQMAFRAPAPLAFAVVRAGRGAARPAGGGHRRAAHAATGDRATPTREDEEELVEDVAAYLLSGAREVQELASNFAQRFNTTVRLRPDSPYNKEGKNDGSFKKWLLSRGFVCGAIFEHNKSMISLPEGGLPPLPKFQGGSPPQDSPAPATPKKTGGRSASPPETPPLPGSAGSFRPPHGSGTPEARRLEAEVTELLSTSGLCDMGALRQVNDFGARFNQLFFQRPKVNDGSWKRWLASLPGVEVVPDPTRAPYHGNKPTMVRLRRDVVVI